MINFDNCFVQLVYKISLDFFLNKNVNNIFVYNVEYFTFKVKGEVIYREKYEFSVIEKVTLIGISRSRTLMRQNTK